MPPVAIDNPILNSPFKEPSRHFKFDEDGLTSELAEGLAGAPISSRSPSSWPRSPTTAKRWIENKLREDGQTRNSGLARFAFRRATGSDKTVVMVMLIAWQAHSKRSEPHAERFANSRFGSASRRAVVPRDQVRPTGNLTA